MLLWRLGSIGSRRATPARSPACRIGCCPDLAPSRPHFCHHNGNDGHDRGSRVLRVTKPLTGSLPTRFSSIYQTDRMPSVGVGMGLFLGSPVQSDQITSARSLKA